MKAKTRVTKKILVSMKLGLYLFSGKDIPAGKVQQNSLVKTNILSCSYVYLKLWMREVAN